MDTRSIQFRLGFRTGRDRRKGRGERGRVKQTLLSQRERGGFIYGSLEEGARLPNHVSEKIVQGVASLGVFKVAVNRIHSKTVYVLK